MNFWDWLFHSALALEVSRLWCHSSCLFVTEQCSMAWDGLLTVCLTIHSLKTSCWCLSIVSFMLCFFWLLTWWVIFYCILDFLHIMRHWILFIYMFTVLSLPAPTYSWFHFPGFQLPVVSHGLKILSGNSRNKQYILNCTSFWVAWWNLTLPCFILLFVNHSFVQGNVNQRLWSPIHADRSLYEVWWGWGDFIQCKQLSCETAWLWNSSVWFSTAVEQNGSETARQWCSSVMK